MRADLEKNELNHDLLWEEMSQNKRTVLRAKHQLTQTLDSAKANLQQVHTLQYNTIQFNTIQYNTILYNTIQYNTIQYNTIQYNTIQYNTIQYNTIQYNIIQYYNTIQCNATFDMPFFLL